MLLLPTPVEVIVELREVVSASRGHQAHDVIGEQGHQRGHDRQVRALLSEALRLDDIGSVWHDDDDP
jgi:hypothetical protein